MKPECVVSATAAAGPTVGVNGSRPRELVERAEAAFRSSAALLRAQGKPDQAVGVERFADWTRMDLDDRWLPGCCSTP